MDERVVEKIDVGWAEKVKTLIRQERQWLELGWNDLAKRVASSYRRFAGARRA